MRATISATWRRSLAGSSEHSAMSGPCARTGSSERDHVPGDPSRLKTPHCHNWPFRLPQRQSGLTRRGFPLRISRREFVAASGAVLATAALMGSTSLAFADPTVEELMRPGPLPDLAEGKADAPVTIIEYASMTCPHCANFHKGTYPALKSKYID